MNSVFLLCQRAFASLMRKGMIAIFYFFLIVLFIYLPWLLHVFSHTQQLNIYILPERISSDVIKAFEKKSGIKVSVKYFESDEELFAKFKITGGDGYDVILASDYLVHELTNEGLLAPLDHNKISNLTLVNQSLLNRSFDQKNIHTAPLGWLAYGILYHPYILPTVHKEPGLWMIFQNPEELAAQGLVTNPYKICMIDEHRETVMIAALHLFNRIINLSSQDFDHITNLLIDQKKWVEVYTSSSLSYFISSGLVPVALCASMYAHKVLERQKELRFVVPQAGSLMVIENLAIPTKSRMKSVAHDFIQHVLSESSARKHAQQLHYYVSHNVVWQEQEKEIAAQENIVFGKDIIDSLSVVHDYVPGHIIEEIWFALRFA